MNLEFTEMDLRIIKQALKIWHGDYPDTNCEPSVIWAKEIKELIEKVSNYEEYKENENG